jgi:hypothetical protein
MGESELWIFCVAGAVVVLVGAMVLVGAVRLRARSRQMLRWPIVTGKVISSEMASTGGADAGSMTTARATVRYAYRVDGKPYESERIQSGPDGDRPHPGPAEQILARYPVGSRVSVHYEPENPGNAALEAAATGRAAALAMFGLALLVIGVAVIIAALYEAAPSVPG